MSRFQALIQSIVGDVRYAARSLYRARSYSIVVVTTLALGIGANTAMFTLVRGTLLRPLPNRDGDRLVYLRHAALGAQRQNVLFSVPEVADLRASSKTMTAITEYSSPLPFTIIADDGQPAIARTGVVTGNYFDVMGLRAAAGRLFSSRDDGPAAPPVAVLSYQFWSDRFGKDRSIIGHTIRINEMVTKIVGVVQAAPIYPQSTDVFVNTAASPHNLAATMVTGRTHRMSEVFARLAPTATLQQARAEIDHIAEGMISDHPDAYQRTSHDQITVVPLRDALSERAALTFWLLMGAATFVLLIACANVSNLTLMRGVAREREMLLRVALGAGAMRIRRLLVIENLLLALAGGVIGAVAAADVVHLLAPFAAQFTPRAAEINVDGLVLVVCVALSIAAGIILSFIPTIGNGRRESSLVSSERLNTMSRARQRFQRSLVVAQIGLCMVLLTGTALLVRTLVRLQSVDGGVHADHLLTLELPIQGDFLQEIRNGAGNLAKYERIRDAVASLPAVDKAAMGSEAPLRAAQFDVSFKAQDRPLGPNQTAPRGALRTADPLYFEVSGIPLLAGRGFRASDDRSAPRVAVVSRAMAQQLFGDIDPIGRLVTITADGFSVGRVADNWLTVVGIVGDTRDHGIDKDPTPTVYEPFAQGGILGASLIVRTSADPTSLLPAITRAIRTIFPLQVIHHVATIEQIRDDAVSLRRLNAGFIGAFGAVALVIAMVGIGGVLAFSVSSRTAEIGIRMSLGADGGQVRRMVLHEAGQLLAVGIGAGIIGAMAATRMLQSLLYGVSPRDPIALAAAGLVFLIVGLAASWLPAARAARIDPMLAIRAE